MAHYRKGLLALYEGAATASNVIVPKVDEVFSKEKIFLPSLGMFAPKRTDWSKFEKGTQDTQRIHLPSVGGCWKTSTMLNLEDYGALINKKVRLPPHEAYDDYRTFLTEGGGRPETVFQYHMIDGLFEREGDEDEPLDGYLRLIPRSEEVLLKAISQQKEPTYPLNHLTNAASYDDECIVIEEPYKNWGVDGKMRLKRGIDNGDGFGACGVLTYGVIPFMASDYTVFNAYLKRCFMQFDINSIGSFALPKDFNAMLKDPETPTHVKELYEEELISVLTKQLARDKYMEKWVEEIVGNR